MQAPYTLEELKTLVAPIAKKHGVQKVSVFGSYGRSCANAQSDVDLLIDKGKIRTLLQLIAFQNDMESALQTHVDIVTHDISDRRFLDRIKADEVRLYEQ